MKKTMITVAILAGATIVSGCEWVPGTQTRAAPQDQSPASMVPVVGEPVSSRPQSFVPRGGPDGNSDDGGGFGGDNGSDDEGGSGGDDGGDGGFGGDGGGGGGGWG